VKESVCKTDIIVDGCQHSSKYCPLCSTEIKVKPVWNDIRVSK